jgi:hypothetical protein
MASGCVRRVAWPLLAAAIAASACAGVGRDYEYEEEVYVSLDGSAMLVVSASIPALVALRGARFPVDPWARIDRAELREFFSGPGVDVASVTLSRRHGRRFAYVTLRVTDLSQLAKVRPFTWSEYRFARTAELVEYRQTVGASSGGRVSGVNWNGTERVAFRFHLPSEIPFHTSPNPLQRGNILEWDQALTDRLAGRPMDIRIQMEPSSILYTTLLLFASTVVAAALTFAGVVWWVMRKGRAAESQPREGPLAG